MGLDPKNVMKSRYSRPLRTSCIQAPWLFSKSKTRSYPSARMWRASVRCTSAGDSGERMEVVMKPRAPGGAGGPRNSLCINVLDEDRGCSADDRQPQKAAHLNIANAARSDSAF